MESNNNNADYQKMLSFVKRLFTSKNFGEMSVIKKEDSIVKFFKSNEAQLMPTFKSDPYFPNLETQQIKILFFTVLRDYVINLLIPEVDFIIDYINFTVIRVVAEGPLEDYKAKISEFYKKILTHKEVRTEFDGVSKAIRFKFIEKYLEAFRIRKGYGSLELFKYRELQNLDDYAHFLKICLILRNVLKIKMPLKTDKAVKNYSYESVLPNPMLKREFYSKINSLIKTQFGNLPDLFIQTSLNSAIDTSEARDIGGVSMFLKILAERSKDAKAFEKLDKGAETPDKSWFNIAKRNHGYYGFDLKLLDEFYIIASENNW